MSGITKVLLLTIISCSLSSCASRYYVPKSLKGIPRGQLVELNVSLGQIDHTWELTIDGVSPVPLWGMPKRYIYVAPGKHQVSFVFPEAYVMLGLIQISPGGSYAGEVVLERGSYDWDDIVRAFDHAEPGSPVVVPSKSSG